MSESRNTIKQEGDSGKTEKRGYWRKTWLSGPAISFVLHLLAICLLIFFVKEKFEEKSSEIEITVGEMNAERVEHKSVQNTDVVTDELINDIPVMEIEPPFPEPESDDTPQEFSDALTDAAMEDDSDIDLENLFGADTEAKPVKLSESYQGRSAKKRSELVRKYGGTSDGQDAVLNALKWLKQIQSEDGSWVGHPAHTSLALLCFLAYGATPASQDFGGTVQSALGFLVEVMNADKKNKGKTAYINGIVTYSLAEAYGMTKIPFLRRAAEDGVTRIINGQQTGGGFDYKYKSGKRWDLSIAGWQIQALKAASRARLTVPGLKEALVKSIGFVKSTYKNGKFGYSAPGSGGNMTGVGTLCLQLLGEADGKEVSGGVKSIVTDRLQKFNRVLTDDSWADTAGKYLYGWYYDTQAMKHRGGKEWKQWNKVFQPALVKNQSKHGYWAVKKTGYGFTDDLKGKVYCTVLCCLQLEVYYRYLPSYNSLEPPPFSNSKSKGLKGSGNVDFEL